MTEKNDYRLLIETEWRDIHHSRIQEWSALGIIAAIHLGLVQLLKFIYDSQLSNILNEILTLSCCFIATLFAVIGILMVCRHRRLMWIKLNWIYEAEEKLGLIKTKENQNGIIPNDYRMKKYSRKYNQIIANQNKSQKKISNSNDKTIWNKLMWPRKLSTSWLMAMIYILLGIIDIGFLVIAIWGIIN